MTAPEKIFVEFSPESLNGKESGMNNNRLGGEAYPNDIRLVDGSRAEIAERVYRKIIAGMSGAEVRNDMIAHMQAAHAAADSILKYAKAQGK